MASTGFLLAGNWGCLLPLLIVFNLFFGKLIFGSTGLWLGIEAVLVLIFVLKIKLTLSSLSQAFERQGPGLASASQSHEPQSRDNQSRKPLGKVIDVQAQEVEDDKESPPLL
ncbi:MAG: hypothetical protein Q8O30_13605 [Candidatus Omnitrophota bacterium]|nr:hypothetical protein [Candidatus Omnitrophota bacterium]